jgi:squalene-hopene/tetraprenyl-beta-curcumene cyclase
MQSNQLKKREVYHVPGTRLFSLVIFVVLASFMSLDMPADELSNHNQQSTQTAAENYAETPFRQLPPLYISKDQIRSDDIGGTASLAGTRVVHGWVIAQTGDLNKPFRRLVFTDREGKYVFRDLPPATYYLSVTGYNLGEAPVVKAQLGQRVPLRAVTDSKLGATEWEAKWAAVTTSPIQIVTTQRDGVPPAGFVKNRGDGQYVFTWLPAPSSPDEPIAAELSISRSIKFIDKVNAEWSRRHGCTTCHTNYQYLIGRPLLGNANPEEAREVRKQVELQVRNSNRGSLFNAIPLALNDAAAGNSLTPITRLALDTLMTSQRTDGGWPGAMSFNPPFEDGDYYPNAMAAVAIGNAPEHYARTEKGAAALAKLVQYLRSAAPENLHNRTILLWASIATPGLMSKAERDATVNELLKRQRADGGWSLASFGNWSQQDGTPNDPISSPSDGYGTGLVTYVLRQTGMSPQSPPLLHAVEWLKTHQRVSGRWFTPSLNYDDGINIITNSGTIYALMALRSCGVADEVGEVSLNRP